MKSFLSKCLTVLAFSSALGSLLFMLLPLPGTIPVLMYHRLGTTAESYEEGNAITEEAFERQLTFLKKAGYRVLTLDQYYDILTGARRAVGREIVITFDDGDMSFQTKAIPILERYGFPVALFIISDKIQTGQDGSMLLAPLLEFQKKYAWLDLQSHSKTHAHFKEISDAALEEEIGGSKKALEQFLGKPVLYLTYPYGEFNQKSAELAEKAGYRIAFTTGHKRLQGIPEGLYSKTRVKIDRSSNNPVVFWYYLSGIHDAIKGTREKVRNFFRR